MLKVTSRDEEPFASHYYAAFLFHTRTARGFGTVIIFTARNAPGSTIRGVESSSKSRSVTLWVDQNSSSSSQEENLGMSFNFFPISFSLFRLHVHRSYKKVLPPPLKF